MVYSFIRRCLFCLPPECAHGLALNALNWAYRYGILRKLYPPLPARPVSYCGLTFPNPIGLAAGLDKNGEYIAALAALGFGFVEIGTVTPRPQPGNPKPRLFRLPRAGALINRMGFNNRGVEYLLQQVKNSGYTGILGINVGKNADTPIERAQEDYVSCLQRVYAYASYIVINISSPNTQGLRHLQHGQYFDDLLSELTTIRQTLITQHQRKVPLFIKVAPDLMTADIHALAHALKKYQMDGLIATNTTLAREGVSGLPHADEQGGLSGQPLRAKSTAVIAQFREALGDDFLIIGVGGVDSVANATEKYQAGANLLQIYTGLIYNGPKLIRQLVLADLPLHR